MSLHSDSPQRGEPADPEESGAAGLDPWSRAGVLAVIVLVTAALAGLGTLSDSADAASPNAHNDFPIEAAGARSSQRLPDVAAAPLELMEVDALQSGVIEELEPTSIESLPLHGIDSPGGEVQVTQGELDLGESLGAELRQQGIDARVIHQVTRAMRGTFDFRYSRPGHRYRLVQDEDGAPLEFRYSISPEESYRLRRTPDGFEVRFEQAELEPRRARLAGLVASSLYGAIRELGEDPQLASDIADIFAWDVDFSRQARAGDGFQILYERLYRTDDDGYEVYVKPGRILAARYSGSAGEFQAVLFEDEEGRAGYYRPDGSSVEREFLVAPLKYSRISSRYSAARRHPILKVTRPHHGIDYAAAEGTPLWSVSDGTVIYRGWGGGFGNLVKIRHTNGFVSYYAHLSRFAKGLSVGQSVSQKEIIGYVGHTGLATGPHVCFRVQKNGAYVNPMQIQSKAGVAVPPERWPAFRASRDALLSEIGGEDGAPLVAMEE